MQGYLEKGIRSGMARGWSTVSLIGSGLLERETGMLLPNNQRQYRTLHIQKDVLPYALC